jgi:BirA family biotin operon repressor/biotin-[acetyl-CoA-carboxylase] ligase
MQDKLDTHIIRSQLSAQALQDFSTILAFPIIDSTNTYLLNLPELEQHSGYVCLAEQQTAGRGRQGREWVSPPMQNIYLSVLWKISATQNISGLSLVVGMAILNALKKINIHHAQIKWPNDIVINNQKLAGILLEIAHTQYVVIGIGLNVAMSLDTPVGQPWISTAQLTSRQVQRNEIVAHILNALSEELHEFNLHGLQSVCMDWPNIDALNNQTIHVQQGHQQLSGIAQGINAEGALLLCHENKQIALYSGEVTKITNKGSSLHS